MHSPIKSISRRHKMNFGAELRTDGTRFKLWAPKCDEVRLLINGHRSHYLLESLDEGWHEVFVPGVKAGVQYKYVLKDGTKIPDPASRFQTSDVQGFSEVIDPEAYRWND